MGVRVVRDVRLLCFGSMWDGSMLVFWFSLASSVWSTTARLTAAMGTIPQKGV